MKFEHATRYAMSACMANESQCIHAERPPVHWKTNSYSEHACAMCTHAYCVCSVYSAQDEGYTEKKPKNFFFLSRKYTSALSLPKWLNAQHHEWCVVNMMMRVMNAMHFVLYLHTVSVQCVYADAETLGGITFMQEQQKKCLE